jgi:hypothetical protein
MSIFLCRIFKICIIITALASAASLDRLSREPPRLTDELHEPPPFSHCLDRSPAVPIVAVALAPRGSCPRCSAVHATTALGCHRMGSARTAAPRLGATLRCRWRVDFPRLHGFVVPPMTEVSLRGIRNPSSAPFVQMSRSSRSNSRAVSPIEAPRFSALLKILMSR